MKIQKNNKEQLERETEELRSRVSQLEESEAKYFAMERTVKQREEAFRLLYENAPLAYQSLDENGCLLEINPAWSDLLGYSREEVIGQWCGEFLTAAYREKFEVYFPQFKASGAIHGIEFEMAKKDGAPVVVAAYGRIGHDEQGRFRQTHCILRDITEQKRAEEASGRSEKIYRQMFERSRAVKLLIDPESGQLIDANPAAESFYGYSAEDLKRMKISDINTLPPEQVFAEMTKAKTMQRSHFFFKHRLASGEIRDVEVHSSPLDLGNKTILYSIIHDVTERKRQEEIGRARLSLMEFAESHTLEELLRATLDRAEALTQSQIGFCRFLEADQKTLSLQAWSTNTIGRMCTAEGRGLHYDISEAGVWVDCIHERRAVVHNDYSALPHRKGLPPGHAPVVRELVVPVFRGNRIVAILGVGNKPANYEERDVFMVSLLADLAWDIAEQKLARDALERSEARFRKLYDEAPVAMYISNRNGEIVSVNKTFLEVLGYGREEVLGRGPESFLTSDSRQRMPKIREKFWSEGQASDLSLEIVTKDGTSRHVVADSVALEDPLRGLFALTVFRDITEQKLAEEALARSVEVLRLVFENMNSGLLVLDKYQRIVLANRYARECLSITDEMLGRPLLEAFSHGEALLGDALPWEHKEAVLIIPGNEQKVIGFNSALTPDKNLRVVLFRDITLILENEDRRKRAEQLGVVGELAAKLSHEIKNPLASVFLGLQGLRKADDLSEDSRLALDIISGEVDRLNENIRHVLEAARPLDLSPSLLSLDEWLGNCVRIHRLAARNKEIDIELTGGPNGVCVTFDESALRRVMTNLIQNALDACSPGGRVSVGWRLIGDQEKKTLAPQFVGAIVGIFVADTGSGLPEDVRQSAVFRPFFTTKPMGTGLGLAVVYDLIERHGGTIRINRLGGMTVFEVLLPAGDRSPCWEASCDDVCGSPGREIACQACEVWIRKVGRFCWTVKGRGTRAETGMWPNTCLNCRIFRETNLSYFTPKE